MKTKAEMDAVTNEVAGACETALQSGVMTMRECEKMANALDAFALLLPNCDALEAMIDGLREALQYEQMRRDEEGSGE